MPAAFILMANRECFGCNEIVESTSSTGEVWHESCYQAHKRKTKGQCSDHAVCRLALVRNNK